MAQQVVFESVTRLTQEEFAEWAAAHPDRERSELLNGRIVMSPPAGHPHGSIEARIVRRLGNRVEPARLGKVFGSSQGFELPSGDTVEPDASFVSQERWEAAPPPVPGKFLTVVPDLVVEILSPGNAGRDRGEKKAIYERNGVREYWLVDYNTASVVLFSLVEGRYDLGRTFEATDQLESKVVEDLVVPVAEILEV